MWKKVLVAPWCLTLCGSMDCSPPGSSVHEILQARILEWHSRASRVAVLVKNSAASAGDVRDVDSVPGLGRSPGGGHGNSLQCSCLENPMYRGVWRVTVHGITKSQTWLKRHKSVSQGVHDSKMSLVILSLIQYFGHLMCRIDSSGKDSDAGKYWRQEEKGATEDEMVGCITNSMDMDLSKLWELMMTGKLGVLWSMRSQIVGHDWATELNWYLITWPR